MKIFHCQRCEQPFRVGPEMAGQQVQCPGCERAIAIPDNAFEDLPASATPENPTFHCPKCEGLFQVDRDYIEQANAEQADAAVQCPHCQASVTLSSNQPVSESSSPVQIDTNTSVRRRKPGAAGRGVPAKIQIPDQQDSDLFAPGASTTPAARPDAAADSPDLKIRTAPKPETLPSPKPTDHPPQTTENQPVHSTQASIAMLLPPKFLVDDPDAFSIRQSRGNHKVLLPDGEGGTAQVDDRIVRVQFGDEKVTLLAMSPEQKARRRLISNIVAIVLAVICLGLAFWLML